MPTDRSIPRNISFYDATHPDVALGGFLQNGSVTKANFLDILAILLVIEGGPILVQERTSSHIVSRTDVPLETGVYDIYSEGMCYVSPMYKATKLLIPTPSIQVSDQPWIHRLTSYGTPRRVDNFRDEIHNRDRKCVISGLSMPRFLMQAQKLIAFEAVHIFPPERNSLWIQHNCQQWITDMDDAICSSKINSAQNGFLLQKTVQQLFDQYLVSVNPDDNYKVVVFTDDLLGLDGRILDPACRSPADPHRVSDEALRWHFRQSVLANVRRGGEPVFEHDFPPGYDMVREILAGPYGQERFELEIASRLRRVSKDNHSRPGETPPQLTN